MTYLRKCMVWVALLALAGGCATQSPSPSSEAECRYLLSWSKRLEEESSKVPQADVERIRAGPTKRDRIQRVIDAEQATIVRIEALIEELENRPGNPELRRKAIAAGRATNALIQRQNELRKASLENDLVSPPPGADSKEVQALERAGLEFDTAYKSECSR